MNKKIKVAVAALSVVIASSAFAGRTSSLAKSLKSAPVVADRAIDIAKAAKEGQTFILGKRIVRMEADKTASGAVDVRIMFQKSPEMNEILEGVADAAQDWFMRGTRLRFEESRDGSRIVVIEASNEKDAVVGANAVLSSLERAVKELEEASRNYLPYGGSRRL